MPSHLYLVLADWDSGNCVSGLSVEELIKRFHGFAVQPVMLTSQ